MWWYGTIKVASNPCVLNLNGPRTDLKWFGIDLNCYLDLDPRLTLCARKKDINLPNAVYAREAKLIPTAWGPWSLSKATKTESWGVDFVGISVVCIVVLGVVVLIDVAVEVNGKIFLEFRVVFVCSCFEANFVLEWLSTCVDFCLFLECC